MVMARRRLALASLPPSAFLSVWLKVRYHRKPAPVTSSACETSGSAIAFATWSPETVAMSREFALKAVRALSEEPTTW